MRPKQAELPDLQEQLPDLPLRDIWPILAAQTWEDPAFNHEKAYVAALLSEAAYRHIPEFELNDRGRVKLVPCYAYQILAARGVTSARDLLSQQEFGEPVIIETRYVIAVIVKRPKVTFVAIRGTKPLYASDWQINFNIGRMAVGASDFRMRVHRGFFTAMAECFQQLSDALEDAARHDIPIYVVGHSLGGAMAAIMHGFWRFPTGVRLTGLPYRGYQVGTHSAYTFGMPRYGNVMTTCWVRNPYHILNAVDIVPNIPPRWRGFENSHREYVIGQGEPAKCIMRPRPTLGARLRQVFAVAGITSHFMERYRRAITPASALSAQPGLTALTS